MIANRLRSSLLLAPLLAALAVTAVARPAAAGDGAAAAEVLFADGKRLAQDGNFTVACPKFEESQKLDPGVGTLYRLADCYEHVGRTASAWAAFLEVASVSKTAGQQARAEDASRRARALEPLLPRLVIRVAQPDLPGLVVKRGDVVVGPAQWSSPIPVDPGKLPVEASAPGYKTWRGIAALQPSAAAELDVPALERDVEAPPAAGLPLLPGGATSPSNREQPFGGQRTAAVIAGAAGVVALGVGSVFGIVSMGRKSDAKSHCDGDNTCDDEGLALRHSAVLSGTRSSIFFVAGSVLAAGGVVLWLTAPSRSPRPGAALGPRAPRAGIAPLWGGATFQMELP